MLEEMARQLSRICYPFKRGCILENLNMENRRQKLTKLNMGPAVQVAFLRVWKRNPNQEVIWTCAGVYNPAGDAWYKLATYRPTTLEPIADTPTAKPIARTQEQTPSPLTGAFYCPVESDPNPVLDHTTQNPIFTACRTFSRHLDPQTHTITPPNAKRPLKRILWPFRN